MQDNSNNIGGNYFKKLFTLLKIVFPQRYRKPKGQLRMDNQNKTNRIF
jgi:hypothetical protein